MQGWRSKIISAREKGTGQERGWRVGSGVLGACAGGTEKLAVAGMQRTKGWARKNMVETTPYVAPVPEAVHPEPYWG
jgi:hypothetical protein